MPASWCERRGQRGLDPVRGPRLVEPARPLERAAEPTVGGGVVRLEPDRLAILGDGLLGQPGIEIGAREAEADHRVVRHQLGHLLELGDAIAVGHTGGTSRPGLAGPVGDLDGERTEPVEGGGAEERGEGGRVLGGTLQRLAHRVRVATGALRELLEDRGGEVVELLGELGRPPHRPDLRVHRRPPPAAAHRGRAGGGGRGQRSTCRPSPSPWAGRRTDTRRSKLNRLLAHVLPGGLLLLGAVVAFGSAALRDSFAALAPVAPWLVFGAGMLLAWRFNRSQLVLALLVLFVADRVLVHVAQARAPLGSTGRVVYTCVALLLPLDLAAVAWMTERSMRGPLGRWLLGALGVQPLAVALLARPEMTHGAAALQGRLVARGGSW